MGRFGVGQAIVRLEDERLLTGGGRYTDDVSPAGQVAAVFVRSPHAHAEIRAVRTDAARAMPGVLAVLTVDDLDAAGMGNLPCRAPTRNRDGQPVYVPPRPPLARGRVRHVGDPVACVVAATLPEAREAAEAVEVDYAPLSAASDPVRALEPGAPQLWPDAPGNLALDWESGDREAVDRLLAGAARVTVVDLVNNRVVPNAMEPRGCLGEFDGASGRYTLRTGGQGVHSMQGVLAEMMGLEPQRIRVIQADVGGGFGMKIWVYPEYPVCLLAARLTGRPVKWVSDRSEGFVSDTHGRDHVTRVQIALDAEGRMLALRASITANLGAYLSQFGPFIPTDAGAKMYNGVYAVPGGARRVPGRLHQHRPGRRLPRRRAAGSRLRGRARGRRGGPRPRPGPGRVPAAQLHPPGADAVPDRDGHDLRQRRVRAPDGRCPRPGGGGRLPAAAGGGARQGEAAGPRIAYYIEQCSGGPDENARIEVLPEGRVRLYIGTQSNGQGHATAYAQLISDVFGIEPGLVDTIQGDTDLVATGRGTGGSRSVPVGGVAAQRAGEAAAEAGRKLAGEMLEAAEADIELVDGRYRVLGTDRGVGLFEVAAKAGGRGLEGAGNFQPSIHTFPNGCHVCELEIDAATGVPEIVRYTIVDDFGVVLNPLMLAGQVHGGVAQGIGQALLEEAVYDATGQLLSGTFLDYAMPRAVGIPRHRVQHGRGALPHQPARHEGRGRGRRHRGTTRRHQRRRGRAGRPRRPPRRYAGHAGAPVAADRGALGPRGLIRARVPVVTR